ncbi:peptidoglycan DD-metalloendopeptidase family protein [Campylobacter hominis]|uniref:Peptidase, M23/M37 family n=1 Tax=Campylobacter hominis (strain ATCC BAA-381 / DSM 21671 / CCUG 45161 / LMG 19568 / NCTC 13146 / CH001A) TaxID=360107 RepID=A7I3Q9_CAMHC|nr:peptidoglycan DD-metalloendopeptidase family protein [Campylobacter hominis]ABS52508.1 peptidase, M23/M37 family [Campylobacter hominis ATCC BAA-381]UAK85644.1 peptidoglycan DD-metalloendopeptidase family protein [Campylobacter hominis]SUW85660.1 M24/M37 family peptidase [Campylobacter hominis]
MRVFLIFLMIFSFSFGSNIEKFSWPEGVSLLKFFEVSKIPLSLYYNLENEDQEVVSEIISGSDCYMLKDDDGEILQILIPVSNELQIQIYKDKFNQYKLTFTPIIYSVSHNTLSIEVNKSPYVDIIEATGNTTLANEFMIMFKNEVDFKKLQKGDKIVIIYDQKTRLGRQFGDIKISAGMLESNGKAHYMYFYDDKYYNENGKQVENFLLILPIYGARIASNFTPKRYHPILHRYRAHLGIDYAAPKGTKIYAAGGGKVTFVGRRNGYGNTVEISHGSNISTLYAHLNGFAKGIKKGVTVKQKQLIAYVGNTGLATGPHLHFGVYRNKVAVNPNSIVKVEKEQIVTKEQAKFKQLVKDTNENIRKILVSNENPKKLENFDNFVMLN